jgi:K+ transporter
VTFLAFFSLAAVVLAVTGAGALYADMGHFGRAPITRIWLILVFPACILSYMGQGAFSARSLAVAMADQAQSHHGCCQVDAHDPAAGGREAPLGDRRW